MEAGGLSVSGPPPAPDFALELYAYANQACKAPSRPKGRALWCVMCVECRLSTSI